MYNLSSRVTFDRHLEKLSEQVLVLGSMVADAIRASIAALKRGDHTAARRIYDADERINERRYAIENEVVTLIATQQPMARDVRFLASTLEIITELERIGDYAKGICKVNLMLASTATDADEAIAPALLLNLQEMTDLGLDMLRRSLDAFIATDVALARTIPNEDNAIDHLYNQIYQELVREMMADTTTIERANHLMWAAHNLERMADRVTNICERVIYVASGELKDLDISDDEYRGM
ncbi:MAG: phosphate signaling complex protein PhoU [Chloroflexota bacterium]